jgi:hypothetical protein
LKALTPKPLSRRNRQERGVGSLPASCCYPLEHARNILLNVGILNTKYPIPLAFQDICAFPISLALLSMYSAIKLDDELMLSAVEVYNEPTYRMLTAELEST